MDTAPMEQTQQDYFRMTDSIPQQSWYWAAMVSVAVSALLWLTGRRDWSAGLSYVQPLGKVVQILADASYRFMGDPEGIDFKDRPRYAGGLAFVASHFTVRTIYETMRPALPEVPLFDSSGTPVGVETVEDRRLARVDLTLRSLLGGTTRIGVTKGLNSESGDLGWLLIFSTGGQ